MSILSALVGDEPLLSYMLPNPGDVTWGESSFQVLQEETPSLCMCPAAIQGVSEH